MIQNPGKKKKKQFFIQRNKLLSYVEYFVSLVVHMLQTIWGKG